LNGVNDASCRYLSVSLVSVIRRGFLNALTDYSAFGNSGILAVFTTLCSRVWFSQISKVDSSFAGELKPKPPLPARNASTLSIMLWSLKLRYWAWQNDNYPYTEDVQNFGFYFDPEKTSWLRIR
jgi:hypothetical protein